MANKFELDDIASKEYISALYDEMIFAGLVNTQFTTDFSNPKRGTSVRVKRAVTFQAYDWEDASDTVVQDIEETANYISIDKMLDCSFRIDTKDWTFYVEEFVNTILRPAVIAVAEKADTHILQKMYMGTQKAVEGITSVSSKLDLAKINKAAKEMKIRSGDAVAVVGLDTELTMLGTIDELIHADKRADNGYAFKNANIGIAMNVAYYSSEKVDNVYASLEASTIVDGELTVKVAAKKYDEQIILEGGTAGQVIAAGQMLKVGTKYFTASERAVVAVGGDVIVKTVGLLEDFEVSATTVSKVSVGGNFVFAKDAVAFVSVVPALPRSVVQAQILTDSESGVGMRYYIVEEFGESEGKSDLFRLDTYVASKVMDPRRIRRF